MGRTRRAVTRPVDEMVQCAVCETVLVLMPKPLSWPTLAELFWSAAGPNEFWVIELPLLMKATWPVVAVFCTPTWFTVLALLSDGELVPCMVDAPFRMPTWVVDELSLVRPFCVTLEEFTMPSCTVVDVLAAWAAEERANTATEAKNNLRMEYPFLAKLSDWFRMLVLNATDIVGSL